MDKAEKDNFPAMFEVDQQDPLFGKKVLILRNILGVTILFLVKNWCATCDYSL